MSISNNTVSEISINDTPLTNNILKNPPSSKARGKKQSNLSNVTFICESCKHIPLIFFSQKNLKLLKYCNADKKMEIISPNNLLSMVNLKLNKKKEITKDINFIDINNTNLNEFICGLHGKEFINYCEDCSKDICYSCSKEHLGHKLIHFSQLIPSNKDIREGNKILAEMKRDLEKFKNNSKEIIKFCESLISIKEIVINNLKIAIDFKKLNFYSIINYKNILSNKIKLIEKPYNIMNPTSEINNNILKKIKNEFESLIKDSEDNILYKNNIDALKEFFEFNDNNIIVNIKTNNDVIIDNDNKSKNLKENNNNINNYLNLVIKNDFSFPLINNNFENIKNAHKMQLEFNNHSPINTMYKMSSIFSKYEASTIMNNKDVFFIINKISSKFNKKIKKLYLCYSASKDGDTAEIFHKKCDYIKNIIIIISSRNKKKFGGFSTESWETNIESGIFKKDENAFIFSLDSYQTFDVIKPENAIYCCKKYGPIFGKGEIFIKDNFFKNASCCNEKEVFNYHDITGKENRQPLSFEKEFHVNDMEVFKIDFESK